MIEITSYLLISARPGLINMIETQSGLGRKAFRGCVVNGNAANWLK